MNHAITIQKLKLVYNNFYSENISFRNLSKSDLFPLFKATENPSFNKYLTWGAKDEPHLNIEIKRLLNEAQLNRAVVISICDKYTGTWGGFFKLIPHDDALEVSLWVHPNFWNSKFSIKSFAIALQIAFEYGAVNKIYGRIVKENIAIKRVTNLLGFQYLEDIFIEHENGVQLLGEKIIITPSNLKIKHNIFEY